MKLLHVRKEIKARKPTFTRQESHRKKKMDDGKWRRPRGIHSKMRLHQRGKKASPSPGYGSPREVEHLHSSGLKMVVVHTLSDVDALQKNEGAIVGSDVGMKKREMIVQHAKKKGVSVLNIMSERFLGEVAEAMKARKDAKKKSKAKAAEKKDEKKDEKKETAKDSPVKAEENADSKKHDAHSVHSTGKAHADAHDDEHKKKEKEEKDKLLTKKV
jgi:large subunit ribosomal protein L32e